MDDNTTASTESTDQATSLISLENLIKSYLNKIDSQQDILKKLREMINDALENDPEYVNAAKEAKQAAQQKSSAKKAVISQPEIAKIHDKLQDGTKQLKEMRASLSAHLQNYAQLSGSTQFEDDDGQIREIVYVAKVVKKNSKYRP